MANEQNKGIILAATIGLVVLVYSLGGVPFLGALVLFEQGNEIMFTGATTAEVFDEILGENVTQDVAAITDVTRQIILKSKYVTDANIRLSGTPGLTNAKLEISHNVIIPAVDAASVATTETIVEAVWAQPDPFTEIEDIDLTALLNGHEEGDIITFQFHSDTPGSLIVATFNVEWGPTAAQLGLCQATEGTFDEGTLNCICPADSIGFVWESGCAFEEVLETGVITGAPSGSTPTVTAPSPSPTIQMQAVSSDFSRMKLFILAGILGLLIYYYGYERDFGKKKRGIF